MLSGLWSKSAEPPEGTTGSDHWVAAAFLTANKPRKTAGSDSTVGPADDRSAHCPEDWSGDVAAVAPVGVRGSELELGQLRRGLQLLVYQFDLLGRAAVHGTAGRYRPANQSTANGAGSAGRVRAPVRQRRDACTARGRASRRAAAFSTRSAMNWPVCVRALDPPIAGLSTSTRTRFVRSSGACRSRRRHPPASRKWRCRQAFRSSSTITSSSISI